MSNASEQSAIESFFERPILNSPYERPMRHWELDETSQPTQKIGETRRTADFVTPNPKPKKHKKSAQQQVLITDDGSRRENTS